MCNDPVDRRAKKLWSGRSFEHRNGSDTGLFRRMRRDPTPNPIWTNAASTASADGNGGLSASSTWTTHGNIQVGSSLVAGPRQSLMDLSLIAGLAPDRLLFIEPAPRSFILKPLPSFLHCLNRSNSCTFDWTIWKNHVDSIRYFAALEQGGREDRQIWARRHHQRRAHDAWLGVDPSWSDGYATNGQESRAHDQGGPWSCSWSRAHVQ